jgi:hypothetical protein
MIEVTAIVPMSADSVLARVIDVVRGVGGAGIEVDHDWRLVAVQGGWWYREQWATAHADDFR